MEKYYNNEYKVKLIETLEKEGQISAKLIEFEEENFDKSKSHSKAKTLSISVILKYKNDTLLHCAGLVEGTKELYSNQKDYAGELAREIIVLSQQDDVVVDEHFTD